MNQAADELKRFLREEVEIQDVEDVIRRLRENGIYKLEHLYPIEDLRKEASTLGIKTFEMRRLIRALEKRQAPCDIPIGQSDPQPGTSQQPVDEAHQVRDCDKRQKRKNRERKKKKYKAKQESLKKDESLLKRQGEKWTESERKYRTKIKRLSDDKTPGDVDKQANDLPSSTSTTEAHCDVSVVSDVAHESVASTSEIVSCTGQGGSINTETPDPPRAPSLHNSEVNTGEQDSMKDTMPAGVNLTDNAAPDNYEQRNTSAIFNQNCMKRLVDTRIDTDVQQNNHQSTDSEICGNALKSSGENHGVPLDLAYVPIVRKPQLLHEIDVEVYIRSLDITPSGEYLYCTDDGKLIHSPRDNSDSTMFHPSPDDLHPRHVSVHQTSGDIAVMYVTSDSSDRVYLNIYRHAARQWSERQEVEEGRYPRVAWTQTGELVMTYMERYVQHVVLYDPTTRKNKWRRQIENCGLIIDIAVHSNTIYCCDGSRKCIHVCSVVDGSFSHRWKVHVDGRDFTRCTSVCVDGRGRLLVAQKEIVDEEWTAAVTLWNPDGTFIRDIVTGLPASLHLVTCSLYRDSGVTKLVIACDKKIRVYDIPDNLLLQ